MSVFLTAMVINNQLVILFIYTWQNICLTFWCVVSPFLFGVEMLPMSILTWRLQIGIHSNPEQKAQSKVWDYFGFYQAKEGPAINYNR